MNRPPPPNQQAETDAAVDELENEFILRLPASLPVPGNSLSYVHVDRYNLKGFPGVRF